MAGTLVHPLPVTLPPLSSTEYRKELSVPRICERAAETTVEKLYMYSFFLHKMKTKIILTLFNSLCFNVMDDWA